MVRPMRQRREAVHVRRRPEFVDDAARRVRIGGWLFAEAGSS
jgi:hypothetical protein